MPKFKPKVKQAKLAAKTEQANAAIAEAKIKKEATGDGKKDKKGERKKDRRVIIQESSIFNTEVPVSRRLGGLANSQLGIRGGGGMSADTVREVKQ